MLLLEDFELHIYLALYLCRSAVVKEFGVCERGSKAKV